MRKLSYIDSLIEASIELKESTNMAIENKDIDALIEANILVRDRALEKVKAIKNGYADKNDLKRQETIVEEFQDEIDRLVAIINNYDENTYLTIKKLKKDKLRAEIERETALEKIDELERQYCNNSVSKQYVEEQSFIQNCIYDEKIKIGAQIWIMRDKINETTWTIKKECLDKLYILSITEMDG
jgi:hypothetical protein